MVGFAWIGGAAVLGGALGVASTILAGRVRRPPRAFRWWVLLAGGVAGATLFALVAWRGAAPLELAAFLALAVASIALTAIDIADHRLPDVIVLPTLAIVVVLLLAASLLANSWPGAIGVLIGSVAMFAAYLVLALISPRGMGMGDVKLAAVIGAATGYLGLTNWLIALVAAFVIGGLVSLVGLATRRVGMKSLVPFGPSMLAGAFVAILIA